MKLALGTVQFGLAYGINNRRGKPPQGEVFDILNAAANFGITALDTAYGYGDSEELIGRFMQGAARRFKVVSKLPSLEKRPASDVPFVVSESKRRLNAQSLDGYLIHRFEDWLEKPELWDVLTALKQEGHIRRVGFSLYTPGQLEELLSRQIPFDLVQVPYSVFDRRFERYFPQLKERGVEIWVRSVFLQGVAFMDPDKLPEYFRSIETALRRLNGIARENGLTMNALCLNFAMNHPEIDFVVVGVDDKEQLEKNVGDVQHGSRVKELHHKLEEGRIEDENILLPYRWKMT